MAAASLLVRRVATGARLLDRECPGWAERIDPENLRMGAADRCVLGQLYGDYVAGTRELGVRVPPSGHDSDLHGQPVAYGFHLPRVADRDYLTETYAALADAWRAAVRERVAA